MRKWLMFALVCSVLSCESKDTPKGTGLQKDDLAVRARLKQQATELAQAAVAGDFEKVVDSMYPKSVESAGGRDKLIDFQRKTRKEMTAKGELSTIEAIDEAGPIVESKGVLYSYVPITIKSTSKKRGFTLKIIFIAISVDGGNNWKFIDDSGLPSRDVLKALVPDFPVQLVLPIREAAAPIEALPKK
jgi:hypothetical protein